MGDKARIKSHGYLGSYGNGTSTTTTFNVNLHWQNYKLVIMPTVTPLQTVSLCTMFICAAQEWREMVRAE